VRPGHSPPSLALRSAPYGKPFGLHVEPPFGALDHLSVGWSRPGHRGLLERKCSGVHETGSTSVSAIGQESLLCGKILLQKSPTTRSPIGTFRRYPHLPISPAVACRLRIPTALVLLQVAELTSDSARLCARACSSTGDNSHQFALVLSGIAKGLVAGLFVWGPFCRVIGPCSRYECEVQSAKFLE
jgi:hypothetical protein